MCGSIQRLYHANQVQQAPRAEYFLNCTKTEIKQKRRKPQGRVEDRYCTIQGYKDLSNEQMKELNYFKPTGDITLKGAC